MREITEAIKDMNAQINLIEARMQTKETEKGEPHVIINARCTIHESDNPFITFFSQNEKYHSTIWAGSYFGAKCDCLGYRYNKRCKHLLGLAKWIKGKR